MKNKLFKVKIRDKSQLAAGELIYVASLLLPQSRAEEHRQQNINQNTIEIICLLIDLRRIHKVEN